MAWFNKKKDMWQLGRIMREDQPIGTRLLRCNPSCRKREFPDLIYFTLSYQGSGLPSKEDFDRYEEVEDILESIETRLGIQTVAVMTMNGKRDWIMYAKDGHFAANGLYQELAEYNPSIEIQRDPAWGQYKDLVKMK